MSDEREDPLDALARAHGADPDELRREISRFRLALDADLSVAAAAAEAGAAAVSAEVLAGEAEALPEFEGRLRARLAALVRTRRGTTRRRLVAAAAAAGLLGAVGGAAIAATAVDHSTRTPSAASSAAPLSPAQTLAVNEAGTLSYAADHRLPTSTILAASGALQATLIPLLARAPHDGELAARLRSLLTEQRTALASVPSPDAQVDAAIRSSQSLLTQLTAGVAAARLGAAATAEPTAPVAPPRSPSGSPGPPTVGPPVSIPATPGSGLPGAG